MPRPSHLSPDKVLRFLQVRSGPASVVDIVKGLSLRKAEKPQLLKIIGGLKQHGVIEELPGGRYRLAGSQATQKPAQKRGLQSSEAKSERPDIARQDELAGRLVLHQDGYGFVVLDKPIAEMDGDLFIPPGGVGEAMHGDRVLAKVQKFDFSRGANARKGSSFEFWIALIRVWLGNFGISTQEMSYCHTIRESSTKLKSRPVTN